MWNKGFVFFKHAHTHTQLTMGSMVKTSCFIRYIMLELKDLTGFLHRSADLL
jgi:hypothetical protein